MRGSRARRSRRGECFVEGQSVDNPYLALHREFRQAGADVLLSSGQACVVMGIAAFSKDGDWIIREDAGCCDSVVKVLAGKGAAYRLGAPLHPNWLRLGLTSHFEYRDSSGVRMRVDFCSRPPRVPELTQMWANAVHAEGIDVVDIHTLIRLKQTRRQRDYSAIGALAQVAGFEQDMPGIALLYQYDYEHLYEAVRRWPNEAATCRREAVQLLVRGATRREVVIALALEQDERIQEDQRRIDQLWSSAGEFPKRFARLRGQWRQASTPLCHQHEQLMQEATVLLGTTNG